MRKFLRRSYKSCDSKVSKRKQFLFKLKKKFGELKHLSNQRKKPNEIPFIVVSEEGLGLYLKIFTGMLFERNKN